MSKARFGVFDDLTFRTNNSSDFLRVFDFSKLDSLYTVKALVKERLDCLSISGLGQDLNELIICEEEESGEFVSFGGQVIFELLFNLIQTLIVLLELLEKNASIDVIHDNRVFVNLAHVIDPEFVYLVE
jgi:hypothetical protein